MATETLSGSVVTDGPVTVRGWLEILDRTGKVARRFPLSGDLLQIGRAYDNDIVIDDPYVSPHHVTISWHEGLARIVDLDSLNGVYFGVREERRPQGLVENDGLFRLGRTTLRFRRHDCPLPDTLVDRPIHAPLRLIERPWVLVLVYFGAVLYQGFDYYLGSSEAVEHVRMVTEQVALVAVVMAWAALWSFPSRLLLGRWNFLIHCGIAAVAIMLQAGVDTITGFICYMLDSDGGLNFTRQAGLWLILLAALYAHMRYLVTVAARRVFSWAAGITATLMVLAVLVQYLDAQEFSTNPQFDITLKPPPLRLVSGISRKAFVAELEELRDASDVETAEGENTP
ncbi:MAG: hypothetical protein C0624_12955 [Desulfuromonas sp.]|nr:MAG: hypothetical protein C0624_12955 [Desulfuromonas sp.]